MRKAKARHILVEEQKECQDLKEQINNGRNFADIAKQYSTCPSGKSGGSLGEFSQGQMVHEFDDVVFNQSLNEVHGPVQTQFGYHLIEVLSRDE